MASNCGIVNLQDNGNSRHYHIFSHCVLVFLVVSKKVFKSPLTGSSNTIINGILERTSKNWATWLGFNLLQLVHSNTTETYFVLTQVTLVLVCIWPSLVKSLVEIPTKYSDYIVRLYFAYFN